MRMHNIPVREGRKTIGKKEIKCRLREHFCEHHFSKNDVAMLELPQIIEESPSDAESDS